MIDPLDEILEAAGIPTEHPTRVVARRGTYNVVRPATFDYPDVRWPSFRAHYNADPEPARSPTWIDRALNYQSRLVRTDPDLRRNDYHYFLETYAGLPRLPPDEEET